MITEDPDLNFLLEVSKLGDLDGIASALEGGVNIDGAPQQNPLFVACKNSQYEAAKLLLSRGANVNAVGVVKGDGGGLEPWTSLKVACRAGDGQLARLLLSFGASFSGSGRHFFIRGGGPLARAFKDGYFEVVKALVECLEDPHEGVGEALAECSNIQSNDQLKVVEYFLSLPSYVVTPKDIDEAFIEGFRQQGSLEFFELLLKHGANVNAKSSRLVNEDGGTALYEAAWLGRLDHVKFLLDRGADPQWSGVPNVSIIDRFLKQKNKGVLNACAVLTMIEALGISPLSKFDGKSLLQRYSSANARDAILDAQRAYRAKLMAESIDGAMGEANAPVISKPSSGPSL